MKKKIYKICGVALALVLVFSLFGAFVPVKQAEAQAYTPNQWNTMTIPSPAGLQLVAATGDVTDMAVAADGTTVYVVDAGLGRVYKSTNGGASFTALTIAAATALTVIAVAPDDPSVVAYVDNAAGQDIVYISTNGGATWANLSFAAAAATEVITDIAVSPARAGTILNRDYVVCTADPAAGAPFGDVYVIGATATWLGVAQTAGFAVHDFTSLALAPNWTGDRVVIAIGSSDATLEAVPGTGTGDTFMCAINVATGAAVIPGINLDTGATDTPSGVGLADAITSSSVALPADFDSTSVGGFRVYVGWTSAGSFGDDVYRVDFNSPRKLQIRAIVGVYSVSYFGTIAGGTLMVGTSAAAAGGVWFTSDPTTSIPSWGAGSAKPPTGATNFIVALTSNTEAFAGTSGNDSGFHKTLDGGLSFNGLSLIEEVVTTISDVMPSPDGSTVFMSTADATDNHSLWRGSGFPAPGYWQRVHFRANGATPAQFDGTSTIIRLSPDYDTDSTLYWFDTGAGATVNIRRSTDAGQMYGGRTAPAAVVDATVESADILYMTDGAAGNVYASTNGGWFFGLPTSPGLGPLYSIAMAPSYPNTPVAGNVLAGADGSLAPGGVALSLDSTATFIPLLSFAAGILNVQVYGDVDYANNNIVYAAGTTATGAPAAGSGIWRYVFGSSTAWEDIRTGSKLPTGANITGLVQVGGALYGSWSTVTAGTGPAAADSFTVTFATLADTGTITINSGSVVVTPTGTATIAGVTAPQTVTLSAGATNVPWALKLAGETITLAALANGTTGTITAALAGAPTILAGGVVDADGDVTIAGAAPALPYLLTGSDTFSLPDAAVITTVAGVAASGAERTLGPTIPAYASAFWDVMDVGSTTAAFAATPTALRGAGNGSSISLWVINATAGANTLFAYNDEMALASSTITVPSVVPFDSITGGNTEFIISWTNIANALFWELEICTNSGCTQRVVTTGTAYVPPAPPVPTYTVYANTLVAGADYYTRVRARDQVPGDAIRSQWSSVEKFTVTAGERVEVTYLGVQPLGPVPGATDVPVSPGFTWSPYASSTKYEFQLATDAGFSDILAEAKLATTGYKYEGKLGYGTTYFWRARGIEPTVTDWSPVSSFTTEKAPPAPPAPPPAPPAPAAPVVTPAIIWAIIAIGAILVIAVIVLILRTRRVA